ncbi:hypothetical protein FOXG_18132 [Fusarium oxysporum f. sp. lycopersici 4287]|uniref:Uncharacterized protein n=2 Tax=Fusarium oxysporum TaxID=5507 RepID=A0A0J9UAJ7_FUSO4|nr:hypothetical protein FOXG_18132 [Fusarium oxysporum f. sp. lycopersici 4287]EXK42832.1 hypothetical protein FOMG_05590 [Fusarium oxysporum f. sp. melonis 26406]KNA96303.1 hypothetical protein FOXG_18132 [Fusarium oxysporum f. sp. lycopersici 4287]
MDHHPMFGLDQEETCTSSLSTQVGITDQPYLSSEHVKNFKKKTTKAKIQPFSRKK